VAIRSFPRHKLRRAFVSNLIYKLNNGALRGRMVPGRERILSRSAQARYQRRHKQAAITGHLKRFHDCLSFFRIALGSSRTESQGDSCRCSARPYHASRLCSANSTDRCRGTIRRVVLFSPDLVRMDRKKSPVLREKALGYAEALCSIAGLKKITGTARPSASLRTLAANGQSLPAGHQYHKMIELSCCGTFPASRVLPESARSRPGTATGNVKTWSALDAPQGDWLRLTQLLSSSLCWMC
jgi:hypothetical protein